MSILNNTWITWTKDPLFEWGEIWVLKSYPNSVFKNLLDFKVTCN